MLFMSLDDDGEYDFGDIWKEDIMNRNRNSAIKWWRYPVAIITFVAAYFLLPLLIGIALTVTNWFSPEYYKSSELWIYVLSDILGAIIGFELVNKLMLKQNYVFQAIWAAIVAIYSIFVAITNRVLGITTLEQFLGVLAMGIVAVVYVGLSCKNNKASN